MPRPVLSTYRLQMRGDCFTFDDAANLLDYLDSLGVSHLYLSPILTAARGSTHGYDVTDPTTVSAALGGPEGLRRLSEAARKRKIGLIVDIVPNHVGVAHPEQNRWWWDLLRYGRASTYADYFDIDWNLDGGRIVLPVLGSDDDVADLVLDSERLRLGDLVFPVAPGTGSGTGSQVHDRQHYRLTGWRDGICGYRRFFSITSLAALRQEDRAVFDASHVEVKRWFDEGLVDGLRIDHPDGLSDPAGYLRWLRELTGPDAWIVVEKILAADESLDASLPVNGTTGYDALREIGGLFIAPAGEAALTAVSGPRDPGAERTLKAAAVTDALASELARLCRTVTAVTAQHDPQLPAAVAALISRIGVYRCDYPALGPILPVALQETACTAPDLADTLSTIAVAMSLSAEVVSRFNQLCGATTAKAVEDCLFYRDPRLVSLNEVGGAPELFGVTTAEFHQRATNRLHAWPSTMTTLSTHDTKRGEDVRARIGLLSQVPSTWADSVERWTALSTPPDQDSALFLWQNIFGIWPADGTVTDELRTRLHGYTEKAIREAATRTSWHDPSADFEDEVHGWLDRVIDGPVAAELTALVGQLDAHARNDSLGQKLIQLMAPGIPDVYQGTESSEDSLVDPDNRRPVDYAALRVALKRGDDEKLRVTTAALALRRARPGTFLTGGYTPLPAIGTAAAHLVSFLRGEDVVVAASRWTVGLAETGWAETALPLPDGRWMDRLSGRSWAGAVPAAALLAEFPVALLERTDD
ncbi:MULTISPECIES: malto-oligosyltrehalose synthase [unclassified Mycolicibacterium]|uniref:malto-oligosyltrehalose synthase n=1 Tax=unclassified Mycolicibacterium TaxID=2636767 RepID=UPI0012DCA17F|nr:MULTISPECIES: malto-oligosyltrehalose synthase [unclassified Mycolicibacterium]MUL84585.1 malto-oligosyltrehalose synthase [Mycolicibacterium sp. CBMA 329]MUL88360.1 malto-oligosyltrehalose synthase [Mycolicibacterium sp. CBMA 331]MUL99191.1 malto-oligosyltrehalose synthase [Mycolicibacterium sp. CBMA 334]MUM25048.1 malto-oligosyltrehalose synthase [Mycolicibacterium sp. CBMA 295]MUM40007.1 malto-oligosyltrehalose synthase [Mycolicibacterium sp. CBMA 247]